MATQAIKTYISRKMENKVSFQNGLCFLSKHHSLFTKKKGHVFIPFSKPQSLEQPCEINLFPRGLGGGGSSNAMQTAIAGRTSNA